MTSLEGIEEVLLGRSCTIERICAELAKLLGVRRTEVGMLRVEGDRLRFLYPAELQGVSPRAAGPDFTGEELQELERTARRVAT